MGQSKSKQNMSSLPTEAAASSSSSSLPRSSTDHQNHYRYEVFLSFRGEDTRFNFTDHLYTALCQRGIETFRDNKLNRGEDISQELLNCIEESRVSIVVFSQNYASSRWCLDELVKILDCRKFKGQKFRAVFYKVPPSDVRHQTGAFGKAFATLDQPKYEHSMGKWREALKEAADLSGWTYKEDRSEAEFIKEIVSDLSARIVNPSCLLQVAAHPIGIESCRQDVIRLLQGEEMVGIWGPGGIGKTTIAKDVFNSICHKFESCCFLADVRSNGLAQLQETLLSNILRDSNLKVSSVDQGVSFIKTRMRHKKVILILDDVSHSSQLQYLVPSPDCYGPGSRILITTRDEHLLTTHQVQSVYKVKMLNDAEALELFSWNAFQCNGPPNNFVELANRAVRYAQGLPLALIVVGRHLCARSKEQWDDALNSYKRVPHKNIQDTLKISFDALEEDYVKELFLDLACFFNGKNIDNVLPILVACHHNPEYGIGLLKEKALITLNGGYVIWMHDLIEEMGKEIVRQQGEPGKRSRLWNYGDVDHVLTDNTGTKKIEGIQVEGQEGKRICLNAKSFSKMKNLKYLVSNYPVKYSGNIDYLSNELRWLDWSGFSMQSFPSNFCPRKLVALKIPDSPRIIRLWEGLKNFPILTSMSLEGCKSLRELPNFTGIPNLEELNLAGCESLVEVHQSVGSLDKLVTLDLGGCSNLVKLPTEISLKSLRAMYLSGCISLKSLPFSIYGLQNLEILNVSGCSKLVTLPTKASISHDHDSGSLVLPKLRVLRINGCNLSTADFIGSLDCLETLTELDLSSNNFVSVPALCKFVNLLTIDLYCCKRLLEIPELPPNILKVNARDCESLERFLIFSKSLNVLEMLLWNCHRFSYSLGYDMEKMENILLNNQNNSPFKLGLPGREVPKWFHFSKEVAAYEYGPSSTCAISFEIPSKLNWENIGVAFCSVGTIFTFFMDHRADISINGVLIDQIFYWHNPTPIGHMWLTYIPLCDEIKGKVDQKGWSRYHCRVRFYPAAQMKRCGVHLVCQPPNEYSNKIAMAVEPADETDMPDWLSCANAEQKRPRTGANDDYHHQQEQQEQPIPSKRHCTEEHPSMAPIHIIDDGQPITDNGSLGSPMQTTLQINMPQMQHSSSQQQDPLQSQQVQQNNRKRKGPSSSGAANSTGTGNTVGPSSNSQPSTPSTPGDGIAMAGNFPNAGNNQKSLMMYGTDGTGGLASSTNQLEDIDQLGDVGSLEDNDDGIPFNWDPADRAEGSRTRDFSFNEVGSICKSSSKVVCCHFSSDGKLLASAGHDKKVVVWNMETLQTESTPEDHSLIITDVRFRPNSTQLATSSFDTTVRLWDAAEPNYCLQTYKGHTSHVMSLDFHPKKTDLFCSCDTNNEIRFWNINQYSCIRVSKGGSSQVRFQPRIGQVMAAASGNVVSIFDAESDRQTHSLQGHSTEVHSLCWDTNGDYLASVSQESVRVWSLSSGKCIHELSYSGNYSGNMFHSCVFHPIYSCLMVIGGYQSMELWNMAENKIMALSAHDSLISALAQSPVTWMVASASHDKSVKVWK